MRDSSLPFACPRSCVSAGDRWCRFRPILDRLGPVAVCSHTVKVKVEYRDGDALKAAVESIGGTWLGQGTHRLFAGGVGGLGFTLPGWRYPLVLGADGELSYDDYGGAWGSVGDLARLKSAYCLGAVEQSAVALGWQCERTETGLTVYHPGGGRLDVSSSGAIDTTGFTGGACHDAREQLGLERLGLSVTDTVNKSEYAQSQAQIQLPG